MIIVAHSFFLDRDPKQRARAKPYAPLATLLAAALLRDAGHEVAVFDATFAVSPDAFAELLDRLKASTVLLIEDNFNYLTKMCTEVRRHDALSMIAAARVQGCRIAVNGPDALDHPQLYLAAGADAVIAGEGELAVCDVVVGFAQGTLAATDGLILADGTGGLHRTRPRTPQHDLDALPLPAWDMIDAERYRSTWGDAHGRLSWIMATSRGCPYACNWCAKPTFGRRYFQRSPASVAEEMRLLKAQVAPGHLWFADDIFGMTEAWLASFADEVTARGAAIPFMLQSRSNLISEPAVEALRRAGCEEVWLGIESGAQHILDAMDKGTSVEGARIATRRLQASGIRAGWFLQLGYPGEEWEDILATRDLVRDERPDEIGVSVAYPLPGTVFHARVAAKLGARRNWHDTDELAMLFEGTFDTAFYRQVRDALHADVDSGHVDELRWRDLARRADAHRSQHPTQMEIWA